MAEEEAVAHQIHLNVLDCQNLVRRFPKGLLYSPKHVSFSQRLVKTMAESCCKRHSMAKNHITQVHQRYLQTQYISHSQPLPLDPLTEEECSFDTIFDVDVAKDLDAIGNTPLALQLLEVYREKKKKSDTVVPLAAVSIDLLQLLTSPDQLELALTLKPLGEREVNVTLNATIKADEHLRAAIESSVVNILEFNVQGTAEGNTVWFDVAFTLLLSRHLCATGDSM
jgi:hypothetical protein